MNYLRGAIIKKTEKFGKNSQKGLCPPPTPSEILDFFEFQTFLKIADPPLGPNSDIFDFPTFLIKVKLQNNCKIIEIGTFLKS